MFILMNIQVGWFSGSPTHNLGNMFLSCSSIDSGWFCFSFTLKGAQRSSLKKSFLFAVVVQSFSYVWLFAIPWTAARQDSLSFIISQCLCKLMSIESVMPSNHHILCHPLILLPSTSQHQCLFQWISSSHQVAEVLELQLQYQSFQWIFRVDFL